jgi:CheY-like chemotaxis protein
VIDTGIGLPPELLNRVFDLFAQADRTLDRSEGGLGIGLTVAQKLAEMHGGIITADSDGLGKGSKFTMRLPLCRETPAGEQVSQSDATMTPQLSQLPQKILVVDDNRDTATSCARLLKAMGHDVQTAFDGLAALEAVRSFKPQTILLDIGLPGMNGFEVAKTLRDEGFANEVIVAVSGYGQPEDRERSRQAGFDDHLVKPVHRDTLVTVIQQSAERHAVAT